MVILVTGSSGFIGSHFCEKLLKEGTEIIGIDNLDPYYNLKLKKYNETVLKKYKNFNSIKGDFRDKETLNLIFNQNDITEIVHIGAKAGVRNSISFPIEYAENNVLGTLNLLECARENDIENFIFAGSSSVYGETPKLPFEEKDAADKPKSPYAASKRACELFGHAYNSLYGINFLSFRFFTVYGPRGRPDMAIYRFVKNINNNEPITLYGDGSFKRDFTYVSDIVNGLSLGLGKKYSYEIFNLGNEKPISINDLISKIEKILEKKATINHYPIQKGDVEITFANISKARNLLGYNPEIDIDTGLKYYIDWFLQEKEKFFFDNSPKIKTFQKNENSTL